jgi:hypothetical protein
MRVGFLALIIVCVSGCGTDAEPTAPKQGYSFRLLGSVASVPGKPVAPPGSDLVSGLVGKKHEAAHVWVECRHNGAPMPNSRGNGGTHGRIRYPDGQVDGVSFTTNSASVARVVIPAGYGRKPAFVNLEIYAEDKLIDTFRIETLAEPVRAIRADEARMKNPRWRVTQKSDGRLYVDIENHAKGTLSVVALKRTTYLDFSDHHFFPEKMFPNQTSENEAVYSRSLPPQGEVEMEETEYRLITERLRIALPNLEIENVYNTPVITVPAPITVRTESGFTIEIPKQRITPFRQGQKVRHDSQLRIKVDHNSADGDAAFGGRFEATYSVEELSEDLGRYGIWELRLLVGGSVSTSNHSLKFPKSSAIIQAGKLPKLSLGLVLKSHKQIATYKGIVPVQT